MKQVIRQLNPDVIVQGGAPGADRLANDIANEFGITCETYDADWEKYGKRGGYIRNKQMLEQGKPDMVVAFYDGKKTKGTAMMVGLARDAFVLDKEYGLTMEERIEELQYEISKVSELSDTS